MNLLFRSSMVLAIAMCIGSCAWADGTGDSTVPTVPVQAKTTLVVLQPWQERRVKFLKAVQGTREGNPTARSEFNDVLTEFDTRPFGRTPMENMEILGVFYVPNQGIEAALPYIVVNAVLGWYDALRFASESGRAEIFSNEGFFKKALILGGPEMAAKSVKFLEGNPERIAQLLAQGFLFAEKIRDTSSYDRQWPTAYGLERINCAQGYSCINPPSMPKDQWDKAWGEAKRRVGSYYQIGKPSAANEKSAHGSQ